jgi:hypothetical protein
MPICSPTLRASSVVKLGRSVISLSSLELVADAAREFPVRRTDLVAAFY